MNIRENLILATVESAVCLCFPEIATGDRPRTPFESSVASNELARTLTLRRLPIYIMYIRKQAIQHASAGLTSFAHVSVHVEIPCSTDELQRFRLVRHRLISMCFFLEFEFPAIVSYPIRYIQRGRNSVNHTEHVRHFNKIHSFEDSPSLGELIGQ